MTEQVSKITCTQKDGFIASRVIEVVIKKSKVTFLTWQSTESLQSTDKEFVDSHRVWRLSACWEILFLYHEENLKQDFIRACDDSSKNLVHGQMTQRFNMTNTLSLSLWQGNYWLMSVTVLYSYWELSDWEAKNKYCIVSWSRGMTMTLFLDKWMT